ncbi:RHS repeat-associated core domain-containing protein [Nissabacter sp. SGAir0207]|uniref:RHS repeat-associated core domain-containing protein n=1 Tax=Nissabacter sp. SGAir0207 TaxID=2126321 RepID=UPI0010CD28BE|nr:RHS repeat-associated core domain-containing protein [Nissabacter sp. SGAir0207]QCR35056.1 type IV secretion protein Rhs [Nissabacter sp. SGAir0207]
MTHSLFTQTPTLTVKDNRGITIRTLNWNRNQAGQPLTLLVSRTSVNHGGLCMTACDARLFQHGQVNLSTTRSLASQVLRRESADSGQDIMLYDAAGHLAWAQNPAGTVTLWAYDELGRPLTRRLQTQGAPTATTAAILVYGENDAVTPFPEKDNLRGCCVRRYDEGGLLTTNRVALSGTPSSSSVTFLTDAEQLPDWPTDSAQRNALLETDAFTTVVQADAMGHPLAETSGSGHIVTTRYDVSGMSVSQYVRLQGDEQTTPLLLNQTRNAAGQVLTDVAGNGVTTTYSYDTKTQRLSTISAARHGDGEVVQAQEYSWDPVGNLTAIADGNISTAWYRNQMTNGTRLYTYDALYQLITATGRENSSHGAQGSGLPPMMGLDNNQYVNYSRRYTYDSGGNLIALTHNGVTNTTLNMVTDNASNQSIRQNSANTLTPETVDWDSWFTAGGQLKNLHTEGESEQLSWDANNCLQAVTLVQRSSTDSRQNDREIYQYRDGIRLRKQMRTLTNKTTGLWTINEVRYLPGLEICNTWQENEGVADSPIEQRDVLTTQAGRAAIRVLFWHRGKPASIANGQIRYSIDDNIGSSHLELDGDGLIISREEYYPFGGTAVWAGRNQTEADYKTVRYSGKERDGTGLYYYGYRYYAPWLCRWTAADPGREVDGLNLYRMVRNNPLTLRDNDGRNPDDPLYVELKNRLPHAIDIAKEMINGAMSALEPQKKSTFSKKKTPDSSKELVRDFIGDDSDETINHLRNKLSSIKILVNKLTPEHFKIYEVIPGVPNATACVTTWDGACYRKGKPFIIKFSYTEAKFTHVVGIGAAIIHEASHLAVNTEDHAYPTHLMSYQDVKHNQLAPLHELARQNPEKALDNAESLSTLTLLLHASSHSSVNYINFFEKYVETKKNGAPETQFDILPNYKGEEPQRQPRPQPQASGSGIVGKNGRVYI